MSTTVQVYGASLTKQIVGVRIARLVIAGRLQLEQSVATWLPDLPAWAEEVTVRHLLHHMSGLPNEQTLNERMWELGLTHRTNDSMLEAVATFPRLETPPGERHHYSNVGYVMLARGIERGDGCFTDRACWLYALHAATHVSEPPLGRT